MPYETNPQARARPCRPRKNAAAAAGIALPAPMPPHHPCGQKGAAVRHAARGTHAGRLSGGAAALEHQLLQLPPRCTCGQNTRGQAGRSAAPRAARAQATHCLERCRRWRRRRRCCCSHLIFDYHGKLCRGRAIWPRVEQQPGHLLLGVAAQEGQPVGGAPAGGQDISR